MVVVVRLVRALDADPFATSGSTSFANIDQSLLKGSGRKR